MFPSIPVYYSTCEKEKREVVKNLLEKIKYYKYQWQFCGDLKIIGITLGIQGTSASHPCFICDWKRPGRGETWTDRNGTARTTWIPGLDKNVVTESLIPRNKVLLPPLHIMIGIMTQLIKQFVMNPNLKEFISSKFPKLSEAKMENGVFCGPDIRKLMNDLEFSKMMSRKEQRVWKAFRDVINDFFGNFKNPNYVKIVEELMDAMKKLGCKETVKVHFLNNHVNYFPDKLGQFSEEQGERFHQDIKQFEK
jgi:hypothetical protein